MATVFAMSGNDVPVKIVERKGIFYIYRLMGVTEISKGYYKTPDYKFKWESKYSGKYNYQPYEEDDVSSYPDAFIDDIRRWYSYLISKV